jgi:hypothetical protein
MPLGLPETPQNARSARSELINDILKPENWPTPKWYNHKREPRKMQTFDEYFTFQLQSRYLVLENDLRTVLGNFWASADLITAQRINDLLKSTRESLEKTDPNLLVVSSALDLAEGYMVWLYPLDIAKARIDGVLLKLNALSFAGKQSLIEQLTNLSQAKDESLGQIRSVLDATITLINAQVIETQISRRLQITRLKSLRLWGLVILVMFLIGSPFVTNLSSTSDWPSQSIFGSSSIVFNAWMNAFAMLLVGAVGGFLSGLLQARSTQVTLTEYLEDMLKLQLKPLVGGIVALILYVVLSWQVLPGIKIENAGSYFIIAFISGFSERYFLRLLDIRTENEKSGDQQIEIRAPVNNPATEPGTAD